MKLYSRTQVALVALSAAVLTLVGAYFLWGRTPTPPVTTRVGMPSV